MRFSASRCFCSQSYSETHTYSVELLLTIRSCLIYFFEPMVVCHDTEQLKRFLHVCQILQDGFVVSIHMLIYKKVWHDPKVVLEFHFAEPDPVQISAFEARYDEILKKATDEYVLPSKYYRDGYNLYRRMRRLNEHISASSRAHDTNDKQCCRTVSEKL